LFSLKCGDCLEILKTIPDKSIDLILCDLPYGTTASTWDKVISIEKLWLEYERIIKDDRAIVLFSSGTFTTKLINSNIKLYRYKWIWVKSNSTNFVNAKNKPMSKYEEICVFSKGTTANGSKNKMIYNPQGLIKIEKIIKSGKSRFGTIAGNRPSHKEFFNRDYTNYPNDVLTEYKEDSARNKLHTNQKPTSLLEYLIKTYSNKGDVVLDNCMGSGSTGIACLNTDRDFIGIEIDEKYFEIAKERIEGKIIENNKQIKLT